MVTVIAAEPRKNNLGEEFMSLVLQGGIEMIRSQQTGRFYATARKTSIPCTFPPEVAHQFVGSQMPGEIMRVETEPYEYVNPDGEVMTLTHTYEYVPDEMQGQNLHAGPVIMS